MSSKPVPVSAVERAAVDVILAPIEGWSHRCHAASLPLVKAMDPALWPMARVARGTCAGVGGQHSWVVVGPDVYAPDARIVDPTLWSYDSTVSGVWYGSARNRLHFPRGGYGVIWTWGRPSAHGGPLVALTPAQPLSRLAQSFLAQLGPLDRQGWGELCSAPVGGWPAAEIVEAISNTAGLVGLAPIDLVGMLTSRNPGGPYLRGAKP